MKKLSLTLVVIMVSAVCGHALAGNFERLDNAAAVASQGVGMRDAESSAVVGGQVQAALEGEGASVSGTRAVEGRKTDSAASVAGVSARRMKTAPPAPSSSCGVSRKRVMELAGRSIMALAGVGCLVFSAYFAVQFALTLSGFALLGAVGEFILGANSLGMGIWKRPLAYEAIGNAVGAAASGVSRAAGWVRGRFGKQP